MSTQSSSTLLNPDVSSQPDNASEKMVMIIMPTYNEAENIEKMLDALFGQDIAGLRVMIIDDNSPDGTGKLVERLAETKYEGRIEVLHRPGKLGLGTAYLTGFQHALRKGAAYIVTMDADFSHDPAVLKRFLEVMAHSDVAVGSRYIAGGSLDQRWKLIRRIISRSGSIYSRTILKLKVSDTTAGFKMFKREVLERLPLDRIRSSGYCFQIEIAYLCQKHGFRVTEVPIHFNERVAGDSKMSVQIALEAVWRVWQVRFKY